MVKRVIKRLLEKRLHYSVDYIDCNAISAHISSPETIDVAFEYLLLKYENSVKAQPSLLIFDNLNALCPMIASDEPGNIIE